MAAVATMPPPSPPSPPAHAGASKLKPSKPSKPAKRSSIDDSEPWLVATEPARPAANGQPSTSPVFRSKVVAPPAPLLSEHEGCRTAWQIYCRAVELYPTARFLGWRLRDHNGKAAQYVYTSYR